jgi:hypothetical protein
VLTVKKTAFAAVTIIVAALVAFLIYDGVFNKEISSGFFTMNTYSTVKLKGAESDKAAEEIQQMHEESLAEKTNTSNMKNLQPHPRIFTLVNKAKLCRDMSVLGATGKAQTDDEVESVDFGDGPKGKK